MPLTLQFMKTIHIMTGLLAIVAGTIAMFARKGSPLHRRSGLAFVGTMLAMTASAFLMAAFLRPNRLNVVAALVTFYLVGTGLLTIRWPLQRVRGATMAFMTMALLTGAFALNLGVQAAHNVDGSIDGMPPQPIFLFACITLLAALGDARQLRARSIGSDQRLVRHLWRMCLSMFIATASFFLGQAKVFPTPLRKSGLLAIPVLLVLAVRVFWLVRVPWLKRRGRALPVGAATDSAAMRPAPAEHADG